MFIGEFRHSLDDKGRLQIPVKWRSKLAAGAVLTKGFDGSLKLYPLAKWDEIAQKLAALPQSQPEARAFVRQTLAGATDLDIDKNGRVVIPAYLREFAGLGKNIVLAGLHNHVEVWEEQAWQEYLQTVDPASSESVAILKDIGI